MIAKGIVYASKEKLAELLSLPDGVELLAIKAKEMEDGFEFLVVSEQETDITRKGVPIGQMRRVSVESLEDKKRKDNVLLHYQNMDVFDFPIVNIPFEDIDITKQNEADVKSIFDEIVKNVKKGGK
ncbi:MAG: hypothetical protein ABS939_14270 [Psychrobacillus sp.]